MPKADSIDWPLYYLWFAILETDNVPSFKKLNEATEDGMKSTLFNLLISGWTTIVYALEMVVLCVVAFLRLLYMWMFIVLSPLAILLFCMKKSWTEIKGLKNITDTINIKSFLVNAFKPTIIVLWIWLALMFATLMRWVITDSAGVKDKVSIWWIEFSTNQDANNNTEDKPGYQTQISRAGFSVTLKHVWKTFMELILSIITVILVYLIIKIAVNMWDTKDFVTKKTKKLQKELWTTLTQLPIVPVPWNSEKGIPTKYTSFEQVRNLPWTLLSNIEYQQKSKMDDQATAVMDIRWVNDVWGVLPKVKTEIHKIITNPSTPWLKQLYNAKQKMMKLNNAWFVLWENASDPYRQNEFKDWLQRAQQTDVIGINGVVQPSDVITWKNMVKWWQDPKNDNNKTLGNLFEAVKGSAKAYATFFGLDNVENRILLANKDIGNMLQKDTQLIWRWVISTT